MQWMHAGRPKSAKKTDPPDDHPWTKEEMTVYQNGIEALAAAVIKQWKLDGSPKEFAPVIKVWEGVANGQRVHARTGKGSLNES